MHPAYGAPVKKTVSTRLRQYNVEPPGLPLKITSGHMLVCFVVSATGVAVAWL
jgi:hypothetical protein